MTQGIQLQIQNFRSLSRATVVVHSRGWQRNRWSPQNSITENHPQFSQTMTGQCWLSPNKISDTSYKLLWNLRKTFNGVFLTD